MDTYSSKIGNIKKQRLIIDDTMLLDMNVEDNEIEVVEAVKKKSSNLRVAAAWTKAGYGSSILVKGTTKSDIILFDCGVFEPELKAKHVFITHGHTDHIGSFPSMVRCIAKDDSSTIPTFYVHPNLIGPLQAASKAFNEMDGSNSPINIQPITIDDHICIGSNLIVKTFTTLHRVQSQGYVVYSSSKGCVLPEYTHLNHRKLREISKDGVKVRGADILTPELVYTGDTQFKALLIPSNLFVFEVPTLIIEVTYLDGDVAKAHERGHVHIDDIIKHEHLFHNEKIVFVHLSSKYGPYGRVMDILKEKVPSCSPIYSKILVNLKSFGYHEHLTALDDFNCEVLKSKVVGYGWGYEAGRNERKQSK